MKKLLIFVLIISGNFLTSGKAYSQLLLNRGKIKYEISQGEIIVDNINVSNTILEPVNVRVYLEDFQYTEPFDGGKAFLAPGTTENSCVKWLRFSPQDFSISGKSNKDVTYSIKVPKDLKEGGYYAILFFEAAGAKNNQKGRTTLGVAQRIGVLFFLETQNKSKKASIEALQIKEGKIGFDFLNQGNVTILPFGVYYIISEEGMVAQRGSVERRYLPSGQKAPMSITLPGDIIEGNYTLVITFDLEDGDSIVKEIDFNKSPSGYSITQVRD